MFKVAERKVKPQMAYHNVDGSLLLCEQPFCIVFHNGIKLFDCNHYQSNCSDNFLLHCRKLLHLSDAKKEVDITRDELVNANGKWIP